VIDNSQGKDAICQSETIGNAMNELREFLFQMVYRNPQAKGEEGKAQEMLIRMFEYYVKHPERLPEDFQDIRYQEGAQRAACDYIAGMTDSFAVDTYQEMFIPKAWTVK
jgi:dGTPase